MAKVDLNCDLEECCGAQRMELDTKLIPLISSCNLAISPNMSENLEMREIIKTASEAGTGIGVCLGFPDMMSAGQSSSPDTPDTGQSSSPDTPDTGQGNTYFLPEEVGAHISYQLGAIHAFAKTVGAKIEHVKPHGVLYDMSAKDHRLAMAIAEAVQYFDPNMILMGPPGSQSIRAAQEIGLPVAREVYADRAYMPDGSLMPKTMEEAIIRDEQEVIARVIRMVKKHKVTACDGTELRMIPDTVCVHCCDDRECALVAQIRSALAEEGVKIKPLASIVKKA